MGGWGSGPQSSEPDTSEARRVDIRFMRKHCLLQPGYSSSLHWTCRGEPSGHIRYTVAQDASALTLDYKVQLYGGDWEPMKYTVPLEALPCRYGGERQYFHCPNRQCARRCEVLYSYGQYFLCRHCCGYLYPSQKGDRLDKLLEAKRKIGARIFEDWDGVDGWCKRKGMHWRTFEGQFRRYRQLEDAWQGEFYHRARGLLGEGVRL
ncbi:hypothetical protein GCM10027297_34410 [Parahaliea aestuarii]